MSVQSSDYLVEEDILACCVFDLCITHSCSKDGPEGRPVPMKEVNSRGFPFGMSMGSERGSGSCGREPVLLLLTPDILKRSWEGGFRRSLPASAGSMLFRECTRQGFGASKIM